MVQKIYGNARPGFLAYPCLFSVVIPGRAERGSPSSTAVSCANALRNDGSVDRPGPQRYRRARIGPTGTPTDTGDYGSPQQRNSWIWVDAQHSQTEPLDSSHILTADPLVPPHGQQHPPPSVVPILDCPQS